MRVARSPARSQLVPRNVISSRTINLGLETRQLALNTNDLISSLCAIWLRHSWPERKKKKERISIYFSIQFSLFLSRFRFACANVRFCAININRFVHKSVYFFFSLTEAVRTVNGDDPNKSTQFHRDCVRDFFRLEVRVNRKIGDANTANDEREPNIKTNKHLTSQSFARESARQRKKKENYRTIDTFIFALLLLPLLVVSRMLRTRLTLAIKSGCQREERIDRTNTHTHSPKFAYIWPNGIIAPGHVPAPFQCKCTLIFCFVLRRIFICPLGNVAAGDRHRTFREQSKITDSPNAKTKKKKTLLPRALASTAVSTHIRFDFGRQILCEQKIL